ncbi:unnamed protein product [Oikopleura dioica]|uniref:Uncharacterized protein n=1 Tax=Oikopleura dioica TaxID=34765 RepID=E4XJ74_OIKDI|nr:unnamed protein product [Oikopleura dioica]
MCDVVSGASCCPFNNPDCEERICYIEGECQAKVITSRDRVSLPCCDEYESWSSWSIVQPCCYEQQSSRTRVNVCSNAIETDYKSIPAIDGVWSEWEIHSYCDGKQIAYGFDQMELWQCPGLEIYRRTHTCYAEGIDTHDQYGFELQFTRYEDCGKFSENHWSDWDIDEFTCNAACLGSGLIRTKSFVDPCLGTVSPCPENDPSCWQECGRYGEWHLWSTWSDCSDSCGGIETRCRKHECATYNGIQDEVEERGCGFYDGWGEWTEWDDECLSTYPAACADQFVNRYRTSQCGVLNIETNEFEFEQIETALCDKPIMPNSVEIVGECSHYCHDVENGVYSFRTIQYFDACDNLVDQITEQCNVESCCMWLDWCEWSDCDCAGYTKRSRINTCQSIADQIEVVTCMVPTLPMQHWSSWSSCECFDDCDCNCQRQSQRFRCPVCASDPFDPNCMIEETMTTQQPEYEYSLCPARTEYTCSECLSVCGKGHQKCFEMDLSTNLPVPGTETLVECSIPFTCVPEIIESDCRYENNNHNCSGKKTITRKACFDKNEECLCEETWTEPCSVPKISDIESSWTPCDPKTCLQTRHIVNECQPELNKIEERSCKPYIERNWTFSGECYADPGSQIHFYNGKMLPCSGTRKRVISAVCPGEIEKVEFIPCGLEIELQTYKNLEERDCYASVPHYEDCQRNEQNECLFSQRNLSCKAQIFSQTLSIIRKPLCPKWSPKECWRTFTLDPKICLQCKEVRTWTEWGECSEKCEFSSRYREEIVSCANGSLENANLSDLQSNNRQYEECKVEHESFFEEGDCYSSGSCRKCSDTGFGLKTITTWSQNPKKSECGKFNLKTKYAPCPLPQCPHWQEDQFASCSPCEKSVTRDRKCIKPLGAEMCDCPDTPFEKIFYCPKATNVWSEWSEFGPCSRPCGGGEKTRSITHLCDPNLVETQSVPCNEFKGSFMESNLFTPCSSNRCIPGYKNMILTHSCLKDSDGNYEKKYGPNVLCYEPGEIGITKNLIGGCSIDNQNFAKSCEIGIQRFRLVSECADLAGQYPEFEDKFGQELCSGDANEPTEWTSWTSCLKKCLAAGEKQEIQTSSRYNECGKMETREQMCPSVPCGDYRKWKVVTKCSCDNPVAAVVQRLCIDDEGRSATGCIGLNKYQIPCDSAAQLNKGYERAHNLPIPSISEINEIKKLDLGSRTNHQGNWTEFSQCVKKCDASGICGLRKRYREPFCTDSEGKSKIISRIEESDSCPCPKGEWKVISDTCGSSNPSFSPGIRILTKQNSCTGDLVNEPAGQCGSLCSWGAWSSYSECVTRCDPNIQSAQMQTRRRSWSCPGLVNDDIESIACPVTNCPYFGAWSAWSTCSVSCGLGQKRRTRYCHGGSVGTGYCVARADNILDNETTNCYLVCSLKIIYF